MNILLRANFMLEKAVLTPPNKKRRMKKLGISGYTNSYIKNLILKNRVSLLKIQ